MMTGMILIGFWLGKQKGSEELYIKDCMDK
jgi:hypothetical protein